MEGSATPSKVGISWFKYMSSSLTGFKFVPKMIEWYRQGKL